MSTIVVWFSCGAASATAAKKTIEIYGKTHEIRIVNNPIAEEHPDNKRFLNDVQDWLGVKIESCINPKYPESSCESVWSDRKYMSGIKGAPCTQELKKKARQYWESKNEYSHLVLGFTYDEIKRHERFILTERSNVIPVLIDLKITKKDCFDYLLSEGIKLPAIYDLGYPNANCIGCVKATSPTYWNHVRQTFPDVFQKRLEQSKGLGVKLVRYKGERIFLDQLPEGAKGKAMKNLKQVECGLFCEELDEARRE